MPSTLRYFLIVATVLYALAGLAAQPALSKSFQLAGATVFPDQRCDTLFYLLPKPMVIPEENGLPKASFTHGEYLGSGNKGNFGTRISLDQFSFLTSIPLYFPEEKHNLTELLKAERHPAAVLTELPLMAVHGTLTLAQTSGVTYHEGGFLSTNTLTPSLWTERSYLLSLNQIDGSLFWRALETGGTFVGLTYHYFSTDSLGLTPVYSSSLPIAIPPERASEIYNLINLNAPGMMVEYPPLSIMYHGFAERLNNNLFAREVEVLVPGYGAVQRHESAAVTFTRDQPFVDLQTIAFKNPVKTGFFKIKITDYLYDGSVRSHWRTVREWKTIDVTKF